MRFRGGYNILLKGKPAGSVTAMPEPKVLYLPLRSERFKFTDIRVKNGQKVTGGDVLASDPENYAVPLLAPRSGTVRLKAVEDHIVIEDAVQLEEHANIAAKEMLHVEQEMVWSDKSKTGLSLILLVRVDKILIGQAGGL